MGGAREGEGRGKGRGEEWCNKLLCVCVCTPLAVRF